MYKTKCKKNKKKLYSKEDSEDEEILFMGKITQEDESGKEGEVDLEVELIVALEELEKVEKEQIFERKVVKMPRRAEIKR